MDSIVASSRTSPRSQSLFVTCRKNGVPFNFSKECLVAFNILKEKLVSAPILVAFDWNLPFKLMRDAINYAIGHSESEQGQDHTRNSLYQ